MFSFLFNKWYFRDPSCTKQQLSLNVTEDRRLLHTHSCDLSNLHKDACSGETGTDAGVLTETQTSLLPHLKSTTHIQYTLRNLQNNRLSIQWIYSKNRYNIFIYCLHLYYVYILPRIATT